MENLVNNICTNSYYNEGKIKKNNKNSFESSIPSWFEAIQTCTKIPKKSDLIKDIENMKKSVQNSTNLLKNANDLSLKYNVPKQYILYALCGNGKFYEGSNNKLCFSANITKVGIGTQRSFEWSEDGNKCIHVSRPNGPDIVSMDDEEINEYLKYIDKENDESIKKIKEKVEKEIEKESNE